MSRQRTATERKAKLPISSCWIGAAALRSGARRRQNAGKGTHAGQLSRSPVVSARRAARITAPAPPDKKAVRRLDKKAVRRLDKKAVRRLDKKAVRRLDKKAVPGPDEKPDIRAAEGGPAGHVGWHVPGRNQEAAERMAGR
ncbi:hypothetical protein CLV67_112234 [Actinoplanes italicus]|uniref:Uncharacterized protein n=1 Tax=Actinoplanes italicus TaxID=113567 RepID=A0A2T0K6X3_9ACTN|nr:hypothetical protein CLV67_112234 [Actinoplanes italicus]